MTGSPVRSMFWHQLCIALHIMFFSGTWFTLSVCLCCIGVVEFWEFLFLLTFLFVCELCIHYFSFFFFLFFVFLDNFAIQFGGSALLIWLIFQCMKRTWSGISPPPPPTLAPCTTSPLPPPASISFDLSHFVVVLSCDEDFSLSF